DPGGARYIAPDRPVLTPSRVAPNPPMCHSPSGFCSGNLLALPSAPTMPTLLRSLGERSTGHDISCPYDCKALASGLFLVMRLARAPTANVTSAPIMKNHVKATLVNL